ncbi:MAG: glycosyltransferase family 2 protein [Lachnospiraceae bacterium]|nr:glycosyltransferase family 2 protein [Lachnospiraceae bacterium]
MRNVSVIIPTYNRAQLIGNALKSVLQQKGQGETFCIQEVLIVDDGSVDDTEAVVRKFTDERVHFHKLEKNGGAGHARNAGAELAKGAWIAFQDSDDLWEENKLQTQMKYLEEHPECCLVTHPIRAELSGGREIVTQMPKEEEQVSVLLERNFADTPTMVIRRDTFLTLGGFDENLRALEDWDLALRFAMQDRIGIVDQPLLWADMRIEGVSSNMANYYDARCRMIGKNRQALQERGLLNTAMEKLLLHAQENGVLEQTGKMLELYLIGLG